jgi:hypothetical protein
MSRAVNPGEGRAPRAFPTPRCVDPDGSSSRFALARMQAAAHAPASHYSHAREVRKWLADEAEAA